MTTVVLHIGQHKTGTSTLQHSFFKSADSFYNSNVVWLPTQKPNHSFIISSAFSRQLNEYYETVKNGLDIPLSRLTRYEARQILIKAVKQSSAQRGLLLIIAEDLCALHPSEVIDLRSFFLAAGATDFRICGYIRSCNDFVNSYAQQMIKQGFLLQEIITSPPRPHYRMAFEKFIDVFGRDAVRIRLFEPSVFFKGSLIEDFLALAEIPISGRLFEEVRVNESIGLRHAKTVSYLNQFFASRVQRKSFTDTEDFLCLPEKDSKFALTADIHKHILQKSQDDIDWAASTFHIYRDSIAKPAKTITNDELLTPPAIEDIARFYHALNVKKKHDEAALALKGGRIKTARARMSVALSLAPDNVVVQRLRDKIYRQELRWRNVVKTYLKRLTFRVLTSGLLARLKTPQE